MSIPEESEYVLSGVVASTGKLTGRSYRLGRKSIDELKENLLTGGMPISLDHDSRKRIKARVLSAETHESETGEYILTARWTLPADEAEKIGNRTGISVQLVDKSLEDWNDPESPAIQIYVDCYHWTDREIVEALQGATSGEVALGGGRLVQLAGEPPLKIIFDFLDTTQGAAALWAAVFAMVAPLVNKFRHKEEENPENGRTTKFSFVVHRGKYKAVVESDNSESVEKMVTEIMGAVERLGLPGPISEDDEIPAEDD